MMERSWQERTLVFLLRLSGGITVTAFFAIFLPPEWMATTHRWLGMGEFPASPVTDYLSRSVAALYTMHGGLLLLLSLDVRRHRPLVVYVGLTYVLFGAGMVFIDAFAGMPLYWTLGEGPPVVGLGLTCLYLVRSVPRAARRESSVARQQGRVSPDGVEVGADGDVIVNTPGSDASIVDRTEPGGDD